MAANCSRGVTGTRSEQLAETSTFGGYYAPYKYSQPSAETVCGSELQQRRPHTRSEQLAETWIFGGYYAQNKYSQPFAETVCVWQRTAAEASPALGPNNWPKRGLSVVIMLSINTAKVGGVAQW